MALKRILATIVTLVVLSGSVPAASVVMGDVSITSNPAGAVACLKGEAQISGVTPVRFRQVLVGDYRLEVSMQGYETHSSRVYLDPKRPWQFDVTLTPRTRVKAAVRSMFIPGWGQLYTDRKGKAATMAALTLVSAVAFLIADHRFDNKFANYEDLLLRYDEASSYEELVRLHPQLIAAQRDAYDAENVRRTVIGVGVGVWALNVIDNLLFFPHRPTGVRVKGLTIAPVTDMQQVGLTIVTKF